MARSEKLGTDGQGDSGQGGSHAMDCLQAHPDRPRSLAGICRADSDYHEWRGRRVLAWTPGLACEWGTGLGLCRLCGHERSGESGVSTGDDRQTNENGSRQPSGDCSSGPAPRGGEVQGEHQKPQGWQDIWGDASYEPEKGFGVGLVMFAMVIVAGIIAYHYFTR